MYFYWTCSINSVLNLHIWYPLVLKISVNYALFYKTVLYESLFYFIKDNVCYSLRSQKKKNSWLYNILYPCQPDIISLIGARV